MQSIAAFLAGLNLAFAFGMVPSFLLWWMLPVVHGLTQVEAEAVVRLPAFLLGLAKLDGVRLGFIVKVNLGFVCVAGIGDEGTAAGGRDT